MSSEDIEAYTVEARKSSDKARKSSDGQYLSVHLPEEIQNLGFKEGDTAYLDLSSSDVDGHEIFFLIGSKEEISRHGLKIRKRSDLNPPYFVRIPITYTFHREDQSFHGLEAGDELNVELDRNKKEFRIYTADDFRYRSKQLSEEMGLPPKVKTPVIAPILANPESSDYTDIAEKTETAGQRFEIVPFDGGHNSLDRDMITQWGGDYFKSILSNGQIQELEADELRIRWNPEADDGSLQGSVPTDVIFSASNVGREKVVLPEKGFFEIEAESEGQRGIARLVCQKYGPSEKLFQNWSYIYKDFDAEPPRLYIPVPLSGDGFSWPIK